MSAWGANVWTKAEMDKLTAARALGMSATEIQRRFLTNRSVKAIRHRMDKGAEEYSERGRPLLTMAEAIGRIVQQETRARKSTDALGDRIDAYLAKRGRTMADYSGVTSNATPAPIRMQRPGYDYTLGGVSSI